MVRFLVILVALGGMLAVGWFFTPMRGFLEKTVQLNPPTDYIESTSENGNMVWLTHVNTNEVRCTLQQAPDSDMRGVIPMNASERLLAFVGRATGGQLQPMNPQVGEVGGVQRLISRAQRTTIEGIRNDGHMIAFGYAGTGYIYDCTSPDEAAAQEALDKLTANISYVRGFQSGG